MKDTNILLFLSPYNLSAKETFYIFNKSMKEFKGEQTNDAPMRYLFEQAKSNQGRIKRILCITSNKVLSEPKDESQFKRFIHLIEELCSEYSIEEVPECIAIPYDYNEKTKEKEDYGEELPKVIYNKLSDCFKDVTEGEEVYIDYTGGLRDISFLMTAIISFLEFKGLSCGEIVYSNYFDKKLYDIHYIYDLYHLINGVNAFVNTGSAYELTKVYNKTSEDNPAQQLLEHLLEFSNALSICNIKELEPIVNNLLQDIEKLESYDDNDMYSAMLKTLAPTIRKKMYLDKGINYPKMIQWCTENNMIQQAATIYTDKMPKYYFEKNMVPKYVDLSEISSKPGHEKYDIGFYTELFDRIAEGIEVKEFRMSIRSIDVDFESIKNTIRCINFKQKKEKKKIICLAYDRLKEFLKKYYEENGKVNLEGKKFEITYGKKTKNLQDFERFWNELKNTNNYWLHKFLYDDSEEYSKISVEKKEYKTENTFRKKAYAIEKVKKGKVPYSSDKLYEIMAYYLVVKIMRNRMNHAGENELTKDEKSAIETLNNLGIKIDFNTDIDSYKKILFNGVREELL